MQHVIGIDAGGTKTHGLLADQAGRVVGEAMGPGANISTGGELAVEKALHEVIDRLLADRDVAPAAIAIGMAGADRADDHRIVRAILHRIARGTRAVVTHDALIALVAGAGDGAGVVRHRRHRLDRLRPRPRQPLGPGRRVGLRPRRRGERLLDRATGAHGSHARVRPPGPRDLAHAARPGRSCGSSGPAEIGPRVYHGELPLASIAALAPLVGQAAQSGDPLAADIVARAAEELCLAASAVVGRLHWAARIFRACCRAGSSRCRRWRRRWLGGSPRWRRARG